MTEIHDTTIVNPDLEHWRKRWVRYDNNMYRYPCFIVTCRAPDIILGAKWYWGYPPEQTGCAIKLRIDTSDFEIEELKHAYMSKWLRRQWIGNLPNPFRRWLARWFLSL